MTTEPITTAKRGRKAIGSAPMSAAERKRRSREQLRVAGGREFLIQVQGMHLEYVEALAQADSVSPAEALRGIVETSLDRHVGVMRRSERMRENGASDNEIAEFVALHLLPELPPMPEPRKDTTTK
jgi:hypothetical protein